MAACSGGAPAGDAQHIRAAAIDRAQAQAAPPGSPPGTGWAAWIDRDIQVDFQNLPRAYSCNDLWYKLHAVLLAVGAREYMSITPYDCGNGAAHGGRSPSVHLRFQTLRPVTGKDVLWANTHAAPRVVRLAPGEPTRLEAGDCVLVKQLEGTLFAYLGLKADTEKFECAATPSPGDFALSVKVLARWPSEVAASSAVRAGQ